MVAVKASLPRRILVKSPYIWMVYVPGNSYTCRASPLWAVTLPSPQSTVYVPVASPTGILMESPGNFVFQVVTKRSLS